jgi:transcriptional regulator with XRE-family HTH domain
MSQTNGYKASASRIGVKIRAARTEAGLSQEALAGRINTSRRNILRWENGHNTPRAQHIVAIGRETGKDAAYFLGDEDEEEAALARDLLELVRGIVRSEFSNDGRSVSWDDGKVRA